MQGVFLALLKGEYCKCLPHSRLIGEYIFGLYSIPTSIQVRDTNLMGLPNPHFFDTGGEGGGFEAEELRRAAGAVNFPVGAFQRGFDVRFFLKAHVLFGQDCAGAVSIFLDGCFQ